MLHVKPSAQTPTAAPHCGSHCHPAPRVLTLHLLPMQTSRGNGAAARACVESRRRRTSRARSSAVHSGPTSARAWQPCSSEHTARTGTEFELRSARQLLCYHQNNISQRVATCARVPCFDLRLLRQIHLPFSTRCVPYIPQALQVRINVHILAQGCGGRRRHFTDLESVQNRMNRPKTGGLGMNR